MDAYFENTFVRDKERVKELYRWYYYRRKKMRFLHIVASVLMVWSIVFSIWFSQYAMGVTYVFFLTMLELFLYRCYAVAVKLCLQRDAENNMGKPATLTTIVKDDIVRTEVPTGEGHDVPLNQMKWAVKTKKMIVMGSKAKILYVFPCDTFVHGTPEGLLNYLREKGIGK